jgi:biofilm protein TabA
MKKISLIALLMINMIFINGCRSKDPSAWTSKKVDKWFSSQEWLGGWDVVPDSSINKRAMAVAWVKNSNRWKEAFRFLRENDLENLDPGRYDIDGDNLYATVSEYMTKDPDSANFEAHRKYIDIQYVVKGNEVIGLAPLNAAKKIITPYDPSRDIEFADCENPDYMVATPRNFFVFFPDDMHKPGLRDGNPTPVRKIVIKLKKN